jgi:hypothetical protein
LLVFAVSLVAVQCPDEHCKLHAAVKKVRAYMDMDMAMGAALTS